LAAVSVALPNYSDGDPLDCIIHADTDAKLNPGLPTKSAVRHRWQ
jgi:hypothetical protein